MTRQINLYNPALRARREWLTGKWLLNGIGILIVLLGLYGGVVRWENQQLNEEAGRIGAELSQRQAELARLNEELARIIFIDKRSEFRGVIEVEYKLRSFFRD